MVHTQQDAPVSPVRQLRKAQGLGLKRFARAAGCSAGAVDAAEVGVLHYRADGAVVLGRIAAACGVDLSELEAEYLSYAEDARAAALAAYRRTAALPGTAGADAPTGGGFPQVSGAAGAESEEERACRLAGELASEAAAVVAQHRRRGCSSCPDCVRAHLAMQLAEDLSGNSPAPGIEPGLEPEQWQGIDELPGIIVKVTAAAIREHVQDVREHGVYGAKHHAICDSIRQVMDRDHGFSSNGRVKLGDVSGGFTIPAPLPWFVMQLGGMLEEGIEVRPFLFRWPVDLGCLPPAEPNPYLALGH